MNKQVIEKIIEQMKDFPDGEINNLIEHIEFLKKKNHEKAGAEDKKNNYIESGP